MSVEKLKAELAVVKTSKDMSDKELFQASKEMNNIIRKELAKARDEGNTNQFASLLAEYKKIWSNNKPGLGLHAFNLCEVDLSGANLHKANLNGAILREANLHGADLREVNLVWTNLSDANLHGATLHKAALHIASLHGVNLREANLSEANLYRANLSGANLSGANLHGADLCEANLHGAITIGADFTEVKNGGKPMTKEELQAKLADAIKTLDELRSAIQRFLEGSNENPVTKQDLDILPSLYKAALDIGNNGAKNCKDESVICQPGDAICQTLLTSARLLKEKFPVLTVTPFSGLHDKMKDVLKGRGGEVSNFMAAVTFLRGIYANQKDSSLSVLTPDIGVKIASALLSNSKEADDYLATQITYQLRGQASTKKFSAKEAIKLKHILSHAEQALPPVNAVLTPDKQKETGASSAVLPSSPESEMQKTGEPPVLGSVVEQQRG